MNFLKSRKEEIKAVGFVLLLVVIFVSIAAIMMFWHVLRCVAPMVCQ